MVYFVALLAIVAVTTMGLGGLKGRFSVDSQTPVGSILTVGGSPGGGPPGDGGGGGTLPTSTPDLPLQPAQPLPTLAAPPGPTAQAGPVAFTPVPSQGGIISGETVAPFYIVQTGDTLWEIALRFSVSVDALRAANNIVDNIIQPGQLIYLGQATQPPSPALPTTQSLPQLVIGEPTTVIPLMPNTGIIKADEK